MSGKVESAFERFRSELDVVVFVVGAGVAGLAVLGFVLFEETATELMWNVNDFLWTSLGWAYLLVMFTLVVFVFFLIFGPWGNLKLGDATDGHVLDAIASIRAKTMTSIPFSRMSRCLLVSVATRTRSCISSVAVNGCAA